MQADTVAPVAHVIQLSVAPVFLLTGIAGMLNVLTGRLARIVDRARQEERANAGEVSEHHPVHASLSTFAQRARLINIAISLCTASAILVAFVVMVLFASSFFGFQTNTIIAVLFISAMALLAAGLLFFLREVSIATVRLRIGLR